MASLTISAVLIGLVGMHALSVAADAQAISEMHSAMLSSEIPSSGMSQGQHTGVTTMSGQTEITSPAIASVHASSIDTFFTQGSTGIGEMNCLLIGMVCVLCSLIAFVVLGLSMRLFPHQSGIRKVTRILRIVATQFVLPTAPSLHTLSISRV